MTEADWLNSTDPRLMLEFLRANGMLSERKTRLFAVACCRGIWHLLNDERSRKAVDVAEACADGQIERQEQARFADAAYMALGEPPGGPARAAALQAVRAWHGEEPALAVSWVAQNTAKAERGNQEKVKHTQAAWLRDLFGPLPFHPVTLLPSIRAWNSGCIVKLAAAAYEERVMPSGHLDNGRLAVLADALQEAGYNEQEVLAHLREPGAVHVRGCWPVDLILDRK